MENQDLTEEQALAQCTAYFGGDEQAARAWRAARAEQNGGACAEPTPDDVFRRLAENLAAREKCNYTADEIHAFIGHFRSFVLAGTHNAEVAQLWQQMTEAVWQSVEACTPDEPKNFSDRPTEELKRPRELDADVVKFQNNKEKWVAFVGLKDGKPYEIFTGLADDEDGILLPKSVSRGKIIKNVDENGNKRYDFQYTNKRGYKTTVEGLSYKFNSEYWNYAKLISGVLRYGMPINQVIKLVSGLQLDTESINTWKNGVERALKKYAGGMP